MLKGFLCVHHINVGTDVQPHGHNHTFTMKAYIIGCTCDLPAKAIVQNFIQYNGAYRCGYCEQQGQTLRTEAGGNIRTFLYNEQSPSGPRRTQATTVQYAAQATVTKSVVHAYNQQ